MDWIVISMSQSEIYKKFWTPHMHLPECIYHDYQIGDVSRKEKKHSFGHFISKWPENSQLFSAKSSNQLKYN